MRKRFCIISDLFLLNLTYFSVGGSNKASELLLKRIKFAAHTCNCFSLFMKFGGPPKGGGGGILTYFCRLVESQHKAAELDAGLVGSH